MISLAFIIQKCYKPLGEIAMKNPDTDKVIEEIAQKFLRVETLKTRSNDSLDFYDCAVWQIEAALQAAYQKGKESR